MHSYTLWTKQLHWEFEQICFGYRLKLKPPIFQVHKGSSQLGYWQRTTRVMSFSSELIQTKPWPIVLEVLKHEIAHQYVDEIYKAEDGHGPYFQKIAQLLNLAAWARKSLIDVESLKHIVKQSSQVESSLLRKARKLLALSESSNEHEAAAAMRKVKELTDSHTLNWLTHEETEVFAKATINHHKLKTETYKTKIGTILSEFFAVKIIHASEYEAVTDRNHKTIEIFGPRAKVEVAEYIYWFLFNNLERLWLQTKGKANTNLRDKNSFYIGLLAGFNDKLQAQEKHSKLNYQTEQTTINSLISLENELNSFVLTHYPRIQNKTWSQSPGSHSFYSKGKTEGLKLSLRHGIQKPLQQGRLN